MKTKRIFLITILLSIFSLMVHGQSKVELKIQLLTPDLIGEVTLDQKPFFDWVKKINSEVVDQLKTENGDKDVLILISLHKEKQATIEIGARPDLSKAGIKSLLEKIKKYKSPRTKISDYSLAIIAKLNNGCINKKIKFSPAFLLPAKQRFAEFKKMSLADKKAALQNWVSNEVIPIVAEYESKSNPKFKGVVYVGKILEQKKYLNAEIDKLTVKNSNYWRAILEMQRGNQIIPFSKACMHIAKGEFDIANRLLFAINFFSIKSTLPHIYTKMMSKELNLFNSELHLAIKKGIALHDKKKYKEAVVYYESLLKDFPHSAWLNYELYFSKVASMKNKDEVDKEWSKSKKIIYKCDPMYYMGVSAKSGKEAYLLFERRKIKSLFKTKNNFRKDFIQYADTALDLGNYGFAAQLYWLILYFPPKDYNNRNILAHYLYCLDKLGVKDIMLNFKEDFSVEFKKIETERKQLMENSKLYKAFKIEN